MAAITCIPAIEHMDELLEQCQLHNYTKKSTIISTGEYSESLFFILEGSVTVLLEEKPNKQIIISYLNKGNFFGELGLFNRHSEHVRSAKVSAKTACLIAEISYIKFHTLALQYPELLYAVYSQMADCLRNTTRKVANLAFIDVAGRVARTLLNLSQHPDAMTHPDGMQIKISRQEIGRIVGCSREMAGRVLKSLEEQGLIEAKGQTIVVFGTR
ncbi:MAG TPA: cAMP-activated global transcriptional regulator CRP [Thiopseudomonas sp.]|nr:cAMP-activated global transcriptional regulator CRP [Thiopseudomonas sp.]